MGCISNKKTRNVSSLSKLQEQSIEHYSAVVWGRNPTQWFNETVLTIPQGTFTFFTISSPDSEDIPKVADCLIIIVEDFLEESSSIIALAEKFKSIWNKKFLSAKSSQELEHLATRLGFRVLSDQLSLLRAICTDDVLLCQLIKEVFGKIDNDGDGYIDTKEMKHAGELLGEDISEGVIEEAMAEMDLNQDGKISLVEFTYWWKRGKQGAKSFQKLLGKMASQISNFIPGSSQLLHSIGVRRQLLNRKTVNKDISIQIGPEFSEALWQLKVGLGKSQAKENLIEDANDVLEFQMQHTWAAFAVKAKSENIAKKVTARLSQAAQGQVKALEDSMYDGAKLKNLIGAKVRQKNKTVYFGMWIDLDNPRFDKETNQLSAIDSVWNTPVDDFINIQVSAKTGLSQVLQNKNSSFWDLGSKIHVQMDHWSKLRDAFDDPKILFFMIMSGQVKMKIDSLKKVLGGKTKTDAESVLMVKGAMRSIFHHLPLVKCEVVKALQNCEDGVKVFARYNNFGCQAELAGKEVSSFLKTILNY